MLAALSILSKINATRSLNLLSDLAVLSLLIGSSAVHAELADRSISNPTSQKSDTQLAQREAELLSPQNASWLSKPRYRPSYHLINKVAGHIYAPECACIETAKSLPSCSKPIKLSMLFDLKVDKQGNISKVTTKKSSGYNIIDKELTSALKESKMNPFIRNGEAVVGTVSLPVIYVVQPISAESCIQSESN